MRADNRLAIADQGKAGLQLAPIASVGEGP
jgi:hypothetical protein